MQFNGGHIGASTPLTGPYAIPNAMSWGANPSVTIGGWAPIEFGQPLNLPNAVAYTITDPNAPNVGYATFSGVIGGPGGLVLSGYPTLANTNAYGGGTTMGANTNVTVTNGQAFGSGGLLLNNGGFQASVPLTGAQAVTNAWTVQAGQTGWFNGTNPIEMTQGTDTTGNIYIDVSAGGGHLTIDGPITGTGWLSKHGAGNRRGTLTLASTASNYTGGTFLDNGSGNLDLPVSSVGPAGAPSSGPLGTGTLQRQQQ